MMFIRISAYYEE